MRSKLDEPGLFLLNGFFRCPDLKPLNLALTSVSSALSPLLRRLFLFHHGLPLISLASESPEFLGVMLLRASQVSRAEARHECCEGCHGLCLPLAEMLGEPFIADVVLEGR